MNDNTHAKHSQLNLLELAKELLAESDTETLLIRSMDYAIEATGAERGMIILFGNDSHVLYQTARNLNKEDIENPEFEVSRTLIERVKSTGQPICLRNALDEKGLKKSLSVFRLKILSVICLPLKQLNESFGVVYLDNRTVSGMFSEETCRFAVTFSDFISIAAYHALSLKQLQNRVDNLEQKLRNEFRFESIIGGHPKIVEVLKLVSQVARTDATVLIQGESGTGKELIARAIHFNSNRRDKLFLAINCAALPENLLESELFGHVRGSFTGAVRDKAGWFERADGGTLFMDEIGETSPALQVKLLRVLQTGEYARVGSAVISRCDVRIIAAASRNLVEMIKEGRFREELYYRLNVIELELPPLRERTCDIPLLVRHFLEKYIKQYSKKPMRFSREAEQTLLAYPFPGNVRELENLVQRAVVLAEGDTVELEHLPNQLFPKGETEPKAHSSRPFRTAKKTAAETFEKEYLAECLRTSKGNITLAARNAGVDVKNFFMKVKKYKLDPQPYKK
jgi:Nif-specific regulatory protein